MNEQKKPLSQREYAKELFKNICDKLGITEETALYKFKFPEDSPIKLRTLKGLKSGDLDVISLTRINTICEYFNLPIPKFFNNLQNNCA